MRFEAIVLAGSRPGADPFAEANGTDLKALIPVADVPMVRRPVTALLASERIATVRVFAQQPERIGAVLPADPRLSVQRSGPTIAATLEMLCGDGSVEWPLLVTAADHALLDGAMIEDFLDRAGESDLAIGVVERAALLRRLPGSRRTWFRFRGGAYSGANLFLLRGPQVRSAIELWRGVEQDRKKGWRLLWKIGLALFPGSIFMSLDQVLGRLSRRLGLEIRAAVLADPLACVDVDKPEDLALVEAILEGRA